MWIANTLCSLFVCFFSLLMVSVVVVVAIGLFCFTMQKCFTFMEKCVSLLWLVDLNYSLRAPPHAGGSRHLLHCLLGLRDVRPTSPYSKCDSDHSGAVSPHASSWPAGHCPCCGDLWASLPVHPVRTVTPDRTSGWCGWKEWRSEHTCVTVLSVLTLLLSLYIVRSLRHCVSLNTLTVQADINLMLWGKKLLRKCNTI